MIAIIRIKGLVGIEKKIEETLYRLKLRRKYSCVVFREKPELKSILKKIRNFVAYGKIDEAMLKELIEKRGKPLEGEGGKIDASKLKNFDGTQKSEKKIFDAEKIAKEFIESKTEKKLRDLGIKDFFGLHPPRGGIKSKLHYPKGVLGNHSEKICELIRRML